MKMSANPLSCLGWVRSGVLLVVGVGVLVALPVSPGRVATAQDTLDELRVDYPDWKYRFIPVPLHLRGPTPGRNPEMKGKILVQGVFRGDKAIDAKEPIDIRRDVDEPGNSITFDEFFRDIMFRSWTHPDNLEKGRARTKITEDRIWLQQILAKGQEGNPAAHQHLRELILDIMSKFAVGNYHPALRYNAMLLIAELNEKEPETVGNKRPAQPWLAVLPVLLDNAAEPRQIDPVKVAALIGIRRHSKATLPATAKVQIVEKLRPFLAAERPASRSPEGHAWIQRLVIESLGNVGTVGQANVVVADLHNILVDTDQPLSLRCSAAMALGKLRDLEVSTLTSLSLTPQQLAGEMGAVAVEACRIELEWLKEQMEKRTARLEAAADAGPGAARGAGEREDLGGIFAGGGGTVVSAGDPVLDRVDQLARRRLKSRLSAVDNGLGRTSDAPPGIMRLTPSGPAKVEIERLSSSVLDVMRTLENLEIMPEELPQKIYEQASKLETQVKKMTVAKAPAKAAGPPKPSDTPAPAPKPDLPDEPF
jgi:hypothetical protein